jgi:hypothetical protein
MVLLFMALSSLLTAYFALVPNLQRRTGSGGEVTQSACESAIGERVSLEAEV